MKSQKNKRVIEINIWFIADTHFGHFNIIKYENRPFATRNEMDETIIKNWNNLVSPEDVVWHLGDVALHTTDRIKEIIGLLNGRKNLILGNHDRSNTVTKWKKMGFENVYKKSIEIIIPENKQIFLASHKPVENTKVKNVHGHVHSKIQGLNQNTYKCVSVECTDYKPIHINKIKIWLEEK